MRVILLGNRQPSAAREVVASLVRDIAKLVDVVLEDYSEQAAIAAVDADLAIVFGGDGAIIRAAHQMGMRQLPTIAVHLGTLGFLATVQIDELLPLLSRPDFATLPVAEHILLRCRVYDSQRQLVTEQLSLNEVSLQSGRPFRLTKIALEIDNEPVTVYRCDGLILSTPVGSTAHNLSAGGPILRKDLNVISICPISPHSLSHRPVVDSADRHYRLRVCDRPAAVIVDGAEVAVIDPQHEVEVCRAAVSFKMIQQPDESYYQTLRDKLRWSGSIMSDPEKITTYTH